MCKELTTNYRLFFLDCLTLYDGTEWVSRNVANYQSTLRNFPKQLRSQIILLTNDAVKR
jgi:hypothetical protein